MFLLMHDPHAPDADAMQDCRLCSRQGSSAALWRFVSSSKVLSTPFCIGSTYKMASKRDESVGWASFLHAAASVRAPSCHVRAFGSLVRNAAQVGDLPKELRDAAKQATERGNDVLGRLSGLAKDYGFGNVPPPPSPTRKTTCIVKCMNFSILTLWLSNLLAFLLCVQQ